MVEVICEVSCAIEDIGEYGEAGTKLCLQKCVYHYDSGIVEQGYRFIRRSPKSAYIPAGARHVSLPSLWQESFWI